MGKEKNDLVRLCAYIGLVIIGVLIFINNVLPLIGVNLSGSLLSAVSLIKDVAILLAIVFGAWSFARGNKTRRIIFWIALALYVASVICGIF